MHKFGDEKFYSTFVHNNASLHCLIFLFSVIGDIKFSVFWASPQHLEIFWKKYRLSLHLVKMNSTDPDLDSDRQVLDAAPDPDPDPAK